MSSDHIPIRPTIQRFVKVYNTPLIPCTQAQFFRAHLHPAFKMICDENNFLQEDLVSDDISAKSKPDDAKSNQRAGNMKSISRSECD